MKKKRKKQLCGFSLATLVLVFVALTLFGLFVALLVVKSLIALPKAFCQGCWTNCENSLYTSETLDRLLYYIYTYLLEVFR